MSGVPVCLRTLMPNGSETGSWLGSDIHPKMGPIFMGCFIVGVAVSYSINNFIKVFSTIFTLFSKEQQQRIEVQEDVLLN